MEKQRITEKMKVHEQWYIDAKKQTLESLPEFMKGLVKNYSHDYGTICHATTASAIGAATAINNSEEGGITGFQAGAIMWEFIRHWNYTSNKTGMKIIDFDNMLYPQYEDKFDKIISSSTWAELQKAAKANIKDSINANEKVLAHWQSIVDGVVPFGFIVEEDDH